MSGRDRDPGMPPNAADAPGAGAIARPRLAVVEDDAELREKILLPVLGAAGFEVTGLASALQLYRSWATSPFDLVLLDIGLPDDDGVEIAAHLRQLSPSPGIVIYTGHGHSLDRLRGLRAGADAYLVKPLDMAEVVQTLHNVNARRQAQARPEPEPAPEGRQHRTAPAPVPADSGGWRLDRQGWSLLAPCGTPVPLNQAERQVLMALAASPGAPVSREALIARLTGDADGFDPHRLEMLVYRLRQKCRQACGEDLPLRAVRGAGYLMEA